MGFMVYDVDAHATTKTSSESLFWTSLAIFMSIILCTSHP